MSIDTAGTAKEDGEQGWVGEGNGWEVSEDMTQEAIRKQTLRMLIDPSCRRWGFCFCSNFRDSKVMLSESRGAQRPL